MLKNIVLHGAATDNAGKYHDAGAELEVGDEAKEGVITAKEAQRLVDGHRAVSKTEAAAIERSAAEESDQDPPLETPPAPEEAAGKPGPAADEAAPKRRTGK